MAAESDLTLMIQFVAEALIRFGLSKGWSGDQFGVYYRPESDHGELYFLFVAEGFNDRDDYECTREVWKFLEKELHFAPDVLKSLYLVVRSQKKVAEGGLYAIGSGYRKYWSMIQFARDIVSP